MKFNEYLKDKLVFIILFLITLFLTTLMLAAFKSPTSLIITILITIFSFGFITLTIDFFRKKFFYDRLFQNINGLDKSYLVLETLIKPEFYEGKLLYNALYDINKSMIENVKIYEEQTLDFKEYIEMWIHEIKIPLSSLILIAHNHPDEFSKKSLVQLRRINDYVEQVLYYTRSEHTSKDYLIKEVSLKKIINNVLVKNKDDILENNIDLHIENTDYKILTDSKWLEFILNQILNNSIKYHQDKAKSYIKINTLKEKNKIILTIEDNGIGIPSSDLPKLFDKSFTGYNGRTRTKSTGMGLFIVKNLCQKLGHKIEITSKQNQYTKVEITFYENDFYKIKN